ncbi:MAG: thiamine pyrophosphate-dependent enzyme [Candidatus Pacebacteria bacterium]|nr:thiamine pyrophosphate-dependent enzyme [Candidatus Paceibacterota bacterium]
MNKLDTNYKNTWCPFCGNFGILAAFKRAIENEDLNKIAITSGIGCHAKIVDYINVNSFYSLHGRSIPAAEGIKLANPELKVIAFTGDGDSLNEGISHLIHAAKRNTDITVILHNNRLFALTTGQFTAASEDGFKGRSTPMGAPESPINPLELMLASNATFISRSYSGNIKHLEETMKKALAHKGFSIIEVIEPCVSFYNTSDLYNKNTYVLEDSDLDSKEKALEKIREWNYEGEGKIPLGVFYKVDKKPYFERVLTAKKEETVEQILEELI